MPWVYSIKNTIILIAGLAISPTENMQAEIKLLPKIISYKIVTQ
jgi:hypothetical protein